MPTAPSESVAPHAGLALHQASIVIDGTCPLARRPEFLDWYAQGGVTAAVVTVGGVWTHVNAGETVRGLGTWLNHIADRPHLRLIRSADDIDAAKQNGQLGIVFHFQGTEPFEASVDLVDAYQALGVRMVQLTYNLKNRVGDGCEERTDAGLSRFGVSLIERLNKRGVVVDCSHTGYRTSLDAMEVSQAPVVISHANAKAVYDCPRNIPDELIKACAKTGGIIGVVGFPGFVDATMRPSLDAYIAHIDHIAELVGIDHVAISADFYEGMERATTPEEARRYHQQSVATGRWSAAGYPPPPHFFPDGFGDPREMPNLTQRLLDRGYTPEDVKKIIGGNWQRIFRTIWNSGH